MVTTHFSLYKLIYVGTKIIKMIPHFVPQQIAVCFSFRIGSKKVVAGIQILECCEMALLTCWNILLGEHQMVCGVK
jgi:hypothetical protein